MFFGGFKIVSFCYLLGSIPFGYIVSKMRGIDIREHGSKNIGATNVIRVLGKKVGIPVFLCDVLKGTIAVVLAKMIADRGAEIPISSAAIMGAICCILGHNFPIWLGFKGGKGIATSLGVMIGMMPWTALASFAVWGIVFFATRYVSLASICAALAVPTSVLIFLLLGVMRGWPYFYFAIVIAVLAIWRHRGNIARLLAGAEPRFGKKTETAPVSQDEPLQ